MDLTWLLLLLCPIMMISMMYFMMKGNHSDHSKQNHNFTEELNSLKRQNETLQQEVQDLKNNA